MFCKSGIFVCTVDTHTCSLTYLCFLQPIETNPSQDAAVKWTTHSPVIDYATWFNQWPQRSLTTNHMPQEARTVSTPLRPTMWESYF